MQTCQGRWIEELEFFSTFTILPSPSNGRSCIFLRFLILGMILSSEHFYFWIYAILQFIWGTWLISKKYFRQFFRLVEHLWRFDTSKTINCIKSHTLETVAYLKKRWHTLYYSIYRFHHGVISDMSANITWLRYSPYMIDLYSTSLDFLTNSRLSSLKSKTISDLTVWESLLV